MTSQAIYTFSATAQADQDLVQKYKQCAKDTGVPFTSLVLRALKATPLPKLEDLRNETS